LVDCDYLSHEFVDGRINNLAAFGERSGLEENMTKYKRKAMSLFLETAWSQRCIDTKAVSKISGRRTLGKRTKS
jgi:hypothetical protein